MKQKIQIQFLFLCTVFQLLCAACNTPSTEIATKINRDGSFERKITVREKSSAKQTEAIRSKIVSLSDYKDRTDSSSSERVSVETFKNIGELQKSYKPSSDSTIGVLVHFNKKFKWFYTYYSYSEIYKAHPLFAGLPVDSFIQPIHINILRSKDSTQMVKDSVERIVKKEFDTLFRKAVLRMVKCSLATSPDSLVLQTKARDMADILTDCLSNFSGDNKKRLEFQIDTFMSNRYAQLQFQALMPWLEREIPNWCKRVELFTAVSMQEIKNSFEMPGTVVKTNAGEQSLNKLSWTLSLYDHAYDFEMYAETRDANMPLWLVSVLLGFAMLFVGASWLIRKSAVL